MYQPKNATVGQCCNIVHCNSKVTLRRAWLVLGWATDHLWVGIPSRYVRSQLGHHSGTTINCPGLRQECHLYQHCVITYSIGVLIAVWLAATAKPHLLYYNYYYKHFTALWTLSDTTQVSQYQKKHSPTHTSRGHQPSLICFLHLLPSITSSIINLRVWQLFLQSLSKFSLVYLLAWHPPLHTPYISSPNQCLLFAAHAHIRLLYFILNISDF